MKHRLPSLLSLLLVAPLLSAACNGEAGPTDPAPAVGFYTLQTVNGMSPPLVVDQNSNGRLEVVGGSLELRGDLSYTETAELRDIPTGRPPQTVSNSVNGTFRLTGQTVRFQTARGELFSGTLAGDTLTYAIPGFVLRYQR